jgi:hypothetical protein
MANIGEVTARVRADVGPYVQGMQQARDELGRFTKGVTGATAALGAEKTALQGLGPAVTTLAAPIQDASSRTQQIGIAFERLERREPTMALRQIRGAVSMLALEAVGATGPLGRLAESFALLGVGSAPVLSALAGLAAFVAAVKLSEQGADDARKAHESLAAAMQKVLTKAPAAAAAAELGVAVGHLEEAQERLDNIHQHFKETPKDFQARMQGLQNDVNTAQGVVDKLRDAFDSLHTDRITKATDDLHEFDVELRNTDVYGRSVFDIIASIGAPAIYDLGVKTEGTGDKMARLNAELQQLAEQITRAAETPTQRLQRKMEEIAAVGGFISPETADRASKMAGKEFTRAMDPTIKEAGDHMSQQMDRAGYAAMRALIDGMLRGKLDLQDILISLLSDFLSIGLGSLFGGILGGGGLGKAGGKGGIGAMPKFSMNVQVPAAGNPIAFARDAQWQAALRESILVANRSGFRAA